MCGKQTFGVFNPAKNLIERLKLEEEEKKFKEGEESDEEFNLEVMQPSSSKAIEEEPVTEIEHIQYADDGVAQNDTDSDDSDWVGLEYMLRLLY